MHERLATLDNPVWNALSTKQASLGKQNRLASLYDPAISPFAAVAEPSREAMGDICLLIPEDGYVLIQSLWVLPPDEQLRIEVVGIIHQMVAVDAPTVQIDNEVVRLNPGDMEDILTLVSSAKPGPFSTRTLEMGDYFGIYEGGRLVAMAGERMRLDGYVEISAICVDNAFRGKGLAQRLISFLRREILQRGDIPFLHVLSENHSAISLYQWLGFEIRQLFFLSKLSHAHILKTGI
ncbi:GNAT family N-acetyltransferase [Pseudomonas yamanorum]|uniref:GNAT family N-acetyltransferase n=1 Tax=Pseudomonas yamanorum TaxID=515393 RepID=UPI00385089B2